MGLAIITVLQRRANFNGSALLAPEEVHRAYLITSVGFSCYSAGPALGSTRLCVVYQSALSPLAEVRDAGRTEIAAGSRTVLAVGPARASEVRPRPRARQPWWGVPEVELFSETFEIVI